MNDALSRLPPGLHMEKHKYGMNQSFLPITLKDRLVVHEPYSNSSIFLLGSFLFSFYPVDPIEFLRNENFFKPMHRINEDFLVIG